MAREFLGERERGFEKEFFHRVDQKLWKQLRESLDVERRVDELRRATGIRDQAVLEELAELGIGEDSLLALSMFPLVAVAWADGTVDPRERDAILQAADQVGCAPGTPARHLLEVWLDHRPEPSVHDAWRDYVRALCEAGSPDVEQAIRQEILGRARTVAEAAGGILGFHKVSDSEEAVLRGLERAIGTGDGD